MHGKRTTKDLGWIHKRPQEAALSDQSLHLEVHQGSRCRQGQKWWRGWGEWWTRERYNQLWKCCLAESQDQRMYRVGNVWAACKKWTSNQLQASQLSTESWVVDDSRSRAQQYKELAQLWRKRMQPVWIWQSPQIAPRYDHRCQLTCGDVQPNESTRADET